MYDLGSKRFRLKNSLLALLGFKKHFRFPHKIGHIFVDEVFNSTLRVAISRKEIELLYSFPCAMPGTRAKMIHSNLDLIKSAINAPDKDYLGERRRGPTMVGDKQGHKSAGCLERGTLILVFRTALERQYLVVVLRLV